MISYYELVFGAYKGNRVTSALLTLQYFLTPLTIFSLTEEIAEEYGKVRSDLENRGLAIGAFDMVIAAHARFLDLTLVTNNLKEFQRVPNFRCESWV